MLDPIGQRLLELMKQRPIPEADVNSIVRIIRDNCTFVPNWDSVDDSSIMKVFGRREAEREAMIRRQTSISSSGQTFYEIFADDEVCNSASNNWISANDDVSTFLNSECREPRKVIVKVESVVRLTIITENCSQCEICWRPTVKWKFQFASLHCAGKLFNCNSGFVYPKTLSIVAFHSPAQSYGFCSQVGQIICAKDSNSCYKLRRPHCP